MGRSVGDVGYFSILAGNIQRPEAGNKGAVIVLLREQFQQGGVVDGTGEKTRRSGCYK